MCAVGAAGEHHDNAVCTLSDARGAFELLRPSDPATTVLVSAARHSPRSVPLEFLERELRAAVIELEPSNIEIGGTVRDANGGEVPGAIVSLWRAGSSRVASVVASDDGSYRLGAPLGPLEVTAQAAGYARGSKAAMAPNLAFDITLAPATTLRGRVIAGPSRSGVRGARVTASAELGTASATTTTSEDGSFEMDGLPVGTYDVEAVAPTARGGVKAVSVGLGEEHVVVHVSTATLLTAKVTVERAPCTAGRASVQGRLTETAQIQPDGSVRLDGLLPGRYFVSVVCSHAGGQGAAAVGEYNVEVASEPQLHMWNLTQPVQVEEKTEGSATLVVTVEQPAGSGVPLSAFITDDALQGPLRAPVQGRQQVFGALKLGDYDVYLEQLPQVHQRVTLEREGQVLEVTLVAPRGAAIQGLVLDSERQPAADVWVRAYHLEYPFGEFAAAGDPVLTDATGAFHIVALLDADYRLVANGPPGRAEVERASANTDVTMTLEARPAAE